MMNEIQNTLIGLNAYYKLNSGENETQLALQRRFNKIGDCKLVLTSKYQASLQVVHSITNNLSMKILYKLKKEGDEMKGNVSFGFNFAF